MNKSESISNIAKSLSQFQGEVKNPANTADNPFFKSKYAPLPDILNDIRPILSKYGLSVLQMPSGDGVNIIITTILMHESGEYIESEPLILKADKPTAQGAGSAITYARRYAISAILGISSEDDDDGNQASGNNDKKQSDTKPESNKNVSKFELTESQIKRLWAIAKSAGASEESIHKGIKAKFNKDSVKELSKTEYDEVCKGLEAKKTKEA